MCIQLNCPYSFKVVKNIAPTINRIANDFNKYPPSGKTTQNNRFVRFDQKKRPKILNDLKDTKQFFELAIYLVL